MSRINKEKLKDHMTCNRLDFETLGSSPVVARNIFGH